MTVAVLDHYRETDESGVLDMNKTVQTLKEAERLLDFTTKNNTNFMEKKSVKGR